MTLRTDHRTVLAPGRRTRSALALLASTALLAVGCATGNYDAANSDRTTRLTEGPAVGGESEVTEAAARTGMESIEGAVKSEMAFPTGDRKTSAVLLEKEMPREVIINTEFEYRILVRNLTDGALDTVRVTDSIPANFEVEGTEPVGEVSGGFAVWNLGALAPGKSKTLVVRGRATGTGSLMTCATVDYESSLCAQTTVVAPSLDVALVAPTDGLSCDPFQLTVTVTNSGSGDAREVRVVDELPDGLTTLSGQRRVVMDFGTLASAQSKEKTIRVKASSAGTFIHQVSAEAKGGLTASAEPVTTVLREPRLGVAMTADARALAGRPIETTIVVANTGNGVSEETVLQLQLPQGAELAAMPEGASETSAGLEWALGTLEPGDKRDLALTFSSSSLGVLVSEAKASSRCAVEVTATARTEVRGMPALLLEVIDESDLILVGENVTYEIRIENQGSAPDKNIVITCDVEENIEVVSTGGAVEAQVVGRRVTFNTIDVLGPGEKAVLQVTVRSTKELDSRFTVSLTSDQKTRPVSETEATNFYK